MNTLLAIVSGVLLAQSADSPCRVSGVAISATIHWSEPTTLFSPRCRWVLDVRANNSDDGASVYLRRRDTRPSRLLFRLNRDATVHWSADGGTLFVDDQTWSDAYRVLLFDFDTSDLSASITRGTLIDKRIRAEVERTLSPGERVQFYFPRFVAWEDGNVVVHVEFATSRTIPGPLTRRCVGYAIAKTSAIIRARFTQSEMRKRYGLSCAK